MSDDFVLAPELVEKQASVRGRFEAASGNALERAVQASGTYVTVPEERPVRNGYTALLKSVEEAVVKAGGDLSHPKGTLGGARFKSFEEAVAIRMRPWIEQCREDARLGKISAAGLANYEESYREAIEYEELQAKWAAMGLFS